MKFRIALAAVLLSTAASSWAVADSPASKSNATASKDEKPKGPAVSIEVKGVHNALRMGRKIISGSCPSGEEGFKSLAAMGVRTVISVDGARPDEALAKKHGMRYVHIPVTYSKITRAQGLSIARAVRDLPGPIFIHCHHGKHRGPSAAVVAAMVNDGWTIQMAQAAMKQAGTSPQYAGLWKATGEWKAPDKKELDEADASFPSSAPVPVTAAAMVSIDERWEHLGAAKEAGWKAPASHPDIDPAHEALLLREELRELARSDETAKRPQDYRDKMAASEAAAQVLEAALRAGDAAKAEGAFETVGASCKSCHAPYRDVERAE